MFEPGLCHLHPIEVQKQGLRVRLKVPEAFSGLFQRSSPFRSCGHVSGGQMAHYLKEADYGKSVVKRARELVCELCDKFKMLIPARPTKMMSCRVLGKVVGLDFSFHEYRGKHYMILHFVCEASRFHFACVAGSAPTAQAGCCSSAHLVELLALWTAFYGLPFQVAC